MTGPLAGLVVADFAQLAQGPFATQMLGDLGAEIIKIERPEAGDDTRGFAPPFIPNTRESAYFVGVNRNKKSITVDIAKPEGQAIIHRLLESCDILAENFKVGALAKYGLGWEQLSAKYPRLIYCSITGFGQTGPYAPRPGYDALIQAMGGVMSLTGDPDGSPYRAGISVFDVMAGLHANIGILAALHQRADTGHGQHVEVNLLSSALSGLVNHSSGYVAGGTVPYRMGNAHPSLFPYEPLPTADGELIVIAGNDGQFRKLCQVLDLPELPDDPRFGRNQDRTANREELRPLLVERLTKRTRDEWFRELLAAGVPCAPINTIDEGVALAEELGLDPVVTVGGVPGVRNPITFSATPASYQLPPPGLDEHGEEIRAWLTGN
jgi:crotonobetainyl-CoA:carnitine CoA-transferase CaiB-like acyl-CoA transferase